MNKVLLVGRLTRDPELRTLPSGKPVANFVVATNEFQRGRRAHRVPQPRRAGPARGDLRPVPVEGSADRHRGPTADAAVGRRRGVRHWKTEVVIGGLEMLSGRGKKEYAKEAQTIAEAGPDGLPAEPAAAANTARARSPRKPSSPYSNGSDGSRPPRAVTP